MLITAGDYNDKVLNNLSHLGAMQANDSALSALTAGDELLMYRRLTDWTKLGSNTTSLNFSGIPSNISHLRLIAQLRTDRPSLSRDGLLLAFNGSNTAANYDAMSYRVDSGTTTGSFSRTEDLGSVAGIRLRTAATAGCWWAVCGEPAAAFWDSCSIL